MVLVLFYRREAACYTLGYNYSLFAHRVHDVLTCIAAVAGIAGAAGVHLMGTGACANRGGRDEVCTVSIPAERSLLSRQAQDTSERMRKENQRLGVLSESQGTPPPPSSLQLAPCARQER